MREMIILKKNQIPKVKNMTHKMNIMMKIMATMRITKIMITMMKIMVTQNKNSEEILMVKCTIIENYITKL